MQSTILRAQLESALGGRISTPFADLDRRVFEKVSTGIPALDAQIIGLPRGAVSEIFGRVSSGKTSMLLSILAAATDRGEVCAVVDGHDAFSPASAADAGVNLKRLLWVRCQNVDQSLKATDLLLQGGGFGVVALDVSDLPLEAVHAVPLATWFRFQRSIEKTPTILTILSQNGVAKTCAALAIRTETSATPSLLFKPVLVTAEIVRARNAQGSHVCFNLYSSFSRSITDA